MGASGFGVRVEALATLLPILFFAVLLVPSRRAGWGPGLRHRFLVAALVWGIVVTALTELLSTVGRFNASWIAGGWTVALLLAVAAQLRRGRGQARWAIRPMPPRRSWIELAAPASVGAILVATGVVALLAQPNNWDSMTYHLSRVAQWATRESVAHYPTHIIRQLHYPPWAEFAIAHFYLLAGGDRPANLVQWFSFLGCTVGVTLIAERLGAGRRGQVCAAVLCATSSMAILQATSTQNDLVVTLWLVCLAYSVLVFRERPGRWPALGVGISLGLALLTKFSALLYGFPFAVWFLLSIRRQQPTGRWQTLAIVAACVGLLNAGQGVRGLELLYHPERSGGTGALAPARDVGLYQLGQRQAAPAAEQGALAPSRGAGLYLNQALGVRPLLSTVLRNLGLQLVTPFPPVNIAVEDGIVALHQTLGMDASDPRTTYGARVFRLPPFRRHEDIAGNPAHVVLIALGVGAFLVRRPLRHRAELVFLGCLIAAALLFCLVFKWQPWHSRLHLGLFILACPFVALQLERRLTPRVAGAVLAGLLLASIPYVVANGTRPLIGPGSVLVTSKLDQLFHNRPDLRAHYVRAAEFLTSRGCDHVGLTLGGNDWEYPFWVLLRDGLDRPPRIEHFGVNNISAAAEPNASAGSAPCAIIALQYDLDAVVAWRGAQFEARWSSGPIRVFERS